MNSKFEDEVIAIGALGGSGTRAVAQLLIDAGIYMGDVLNLANDNLVFTAALKNPEWYGRASAREIDEHLQIFESYMRQGALTPEDIQKVDVHFGNNPEFPKTIFKKIGKKKPLKKARNIWGWKEPNTQIFLEPLSRYFPKLKYIHVLRHGLDMAFASNKNQLFNWGHLFDVEAHPDENKKVLAGKQLDYWIRSTQTALSVGETLLQDRFYVVRYEEICTDPEKEIQKLMNFLGMDVSANLASLCRIFSLSEGHGRYQEQDLRIFSKEQLKAVEELGFRIG